jgi:hypothetical protein
MRPITMGIRDELLEDVGVRYRAAAQAKKDHILKKFVVISGYPLSMRNGSCAAILLWSGHNRDRNVAFMTMRCAKR